MCIMRTAKLFWFIPVDRKPPDHWPSEGAIEVNNLCLSYTKDGPNFLKNITFSIFPLEKVNSCIFEVEV